MTRWGLAILLIAASVLPATATSYDDLNAGIQSCNIGDWSSAVLYLDKALVANDLSPGLQQVAYMDRGEAKLWLHQPQPAIADFTASLALRAHDVTALTLRMRAYIATGKFSEAVSDIDDVIALRPPSAAGYLERAAIDAALGQAQTAAGDRAKARALLRDGFSIGVTAWEAGAYAEAEGDFSAALPAHGAYGWLWLALDQASQDESISRVGLPSLDKSKWPYPLIDLFLGGTTQEAAFTAARQGGAALAADQICEANFYSGAWRAAHHDAEAARLLIQDAAMHCSLGHVEWLPAQVALARLR